MGTSAVEQRLQHMETELQQIKGLLTELLVIAKAKKVALETDGILSAREVADLLKLDINLIYTKCGKGEIPHFKMGKLYKFKKSEILKWMQSQETTSPFSVDDYVDRYLQGHTLKG
jgi:excisionase family DNA binding protein